MSNGEIFGMLGFSLALVVIILSLTGGQDIGLVQMTWPDKTCVAVVEPEGLDCAMIAMIVGS